MYQPHLSSSAFVPPEGCDPARCNPSITLLLGRLISGQEHLIHSVDGIHHAMEIGDRRMQRLDDLSSRLDERLRTLERAAGTAPSKSDISEMEQRLVRLGVYLVPAGALYMTGSWDTAIKLLSALK